MSTILFNVPGLSPREDRQNLPPQLAYFPTGLPRSMPSTAVVRSAEATAVEQAEECVERSLPLDTAQAKASLADMLRMGEEFAVGGLLKELAAHYHLQNTTNRWSSRPGEEAALGHFSQTGETPDVGETISMPDWSASSTEARSATSAQIRREMENCQNVLLLAQSLEQRERELGDLEKQYARLEESLHNLLEEGQMGDYSPDYDEARPVNRQREGSPGGRSRSKGSSLSWRAVVDAVLPFLPERTVLFTDDEQMALDMRDAGMLQPFSEDKAELCAGWPHNLTVGLLHASLPAWRLVGRCGPLPSRPWLERTVEVFVARPIGGWAASSGAGEANQRGNTSES